ncbi:tryptophan-rich sensory protein [Bizionia argentinensis JUB59]|uniref:Tryptophan-rich sensory protein n=1 Tax=Bizionia argentinensis JUB59 TaxID=1046627 RepID=G2ECF8_9FLAO|nr:TspO/MBR family protein [Bizionia argentinensis]EGV43847.1 tryptophan-rich sensory protein [Bizionia argentinensis JUB59]
MKFIPLLILFLIINFGSLAIGNWFMGDGATSNWYTNLNKAPWTPPGWVFGAAWTLIMICFSIYLSYLFKDYQSPIIIGVFILQVILNVSWNYLFFNQHLVLPALIVITLLTLVIFYFFFTFRMDAINSWRYLLLPYMIWLCIATSLNLYVLLKN